MNSLNKKQKIIAIIPKITPIITSNMLLISKASGIKSKHMTASISPDAKANIKLKNLFEFLLENIPIIPPIVVPIVPKNKPNKDISSIIKNSFLDIVLSKKKFYDYSSFPFSFSAVSAAIKLSIISSKSPFRKLSIWYMLIPIL